jgi:5'-nucleotidase (lipoprotein e(P4) family)
MKNYTIILLIAFSVVFTGCCNNKKNTDDLQIHAKELIVDKIIVGDSVADYLISGTLWIQRSAEYRANCYQAFNFAKLALKNNLEKAPKDKPAAVVLDIDETVLDNSPFQADLVLGNKKYSSELWKEWTDMAVAVPTPGAIDFLIYAKSLGVEIIYVTNRKSHERDSTIKNMDSLKFPEVKPENWIFREKDSPSSKEERRKKVSEKYNIILLIGDNLADFQSGYEERSDKNNYAFDLVDKESEMFGQQYIILPNPMYGNWDDPLSSNRKKELRGYQNICTKN